MVFGMGREGKRASKRWPLHSGEKVNGHARGGQGMDNISTALLTLRLWSRFFQNKTM